MKNVKTKMTIIRDMRIFKACLMSKSISNGYTKTKTKKTSKCTLYKKSRNHD